VLNFLQLFTLVLHCEFTITTMIMMPNKINVIFYRSILMMFIDIFDAWSKWL